LGCLTNEVILRFIRARPDLLWFHAGGAAFKGQAVVISGRSGHGKSTVVTSLYEIGWDYLSDEIMPLHPQSGKVFPFPETPYVRMNRQGGEVAHEQLRELPKFEADIKTDSLCRDPVPIAALIFPHYNPSLPTRLTLCSPATAALEILQNCLNL